MSIKYFFAVLTFLATCKISYAQPSSELERLKERIVTILEESTATNYNISFCVSALKTDLKKNLKQQDPDAYIRKVSGETYALKTGKSITQMASEIKRMANEHQREQDKEKLILTTVRSINEVIQSPVYKVPVFGQIQKELNKHIFDAAESELIKNHQKKLAYHLQQYRASNLDAYTKLVESGSTEQLKTILQETNYFASQTTSGIDPGNAAIVKATQEHFLKDVNLKTFVRLIDENEMQNLRIDGVNKNLDVLSKFANEFATVTTERLQHLSNDQNSLMKSFDEFADEYKKDLAGQKYIQEYLFDKMNPSEKIAALNAGILSSKYSPDQLAMMRNQLQLEEQRVKLISSAKSYLDNTSLILNTFANLGIGKNSELVTNISNAVEIGSVGIEAFDAFSSGRFLEGISTLSGLFGKRNDIAEQRHRQIMDYLQSIKGQIDELDKKTDQILKNQERMYDLQAKTYQLLVEVVKEVEENQTQLLKKLDKIEDGVIVNRILISNSFRSQCIDCINSLDILDIDLESQVIPSYNSIRKKYKNIKDFEFKRCEDMLTNYTIDPSTSDVRPYFLMDAYEKTPANKAIIDEQIEINKLNLELLWALSDQRGNEFLFSAICSPQQDCRELRAKYESDTLLWASEFKVVEKGPYEELISANAAIIYGKSARNIHFIVSLTDENRSLLKPEDLNSEDVHRTRFDFFEKAIKIGRIAIAQQNLMSGDLLIPSIYQLYTDQNNPKYSDDEKELSKQLLMKNSLLARNYMVYSIKSQLEAGENSFSQYYFALTSRKPELLTKLLKFPFAVHYVTATDPRMKENNITEGWYMFIDKVPIAIPNWEMIRDGKIEHTRYMNGLLANNSALFSQLLNCRLASGQEDRTTYNLIAIRNSFQPE